MSDMLMRAYSAYVASPGNALENVRAALLAVVDPEDEELWDEIGCEIGGGSGDEAQAVEAAFYVRLVIRELRKRIAQGEPSSQEQVREKDNG